MFFSIFERDTMSWICFMTGYLKNYHLETASFFQFLLGFTNNSWVIEETKIKDNWTLKPRAVNKNINLGPQTIKRIDLDIIKFVFVMSSP